MTDPRQPIIFRYYDAKLGVHQISPFPEDDAIAAAIQDVKPLASRTRFITIIECFANILYYAFKDVGEEELADQVQQTGLDWEHFVANEIPHMDPSDPTKSTDAVMQAIIDDLETQTEDFRTKVNALFVARPNVTKRIELEMQNRRDNVPCEEGQ